MASFLLMHTVKLYAKQCSCIVRTDMEMPKMQMTYVVGHNKCVTLALSTVFSTVPVASG